MHPQSRAIVLGRTLHLVTAYRTISRLQAVRCCVERTVGDAIALQVIAFYKTLQLAVCDRMHGDTAHSSRVAIGEEVPLSKSAIDVINWSPSSAKSSP